MPLEYVNDRLEALDREPVDMVIGGVQLQGIYEVEESGAGFTEEWKAERERESGGAVTKDEVDEPPAAELRVTAWGDAEDWSALNDLRKQRNPFSVSIGPFAFAQMGISGLSATEVAEYPEAREFDIQLTEYREVVVQRQSLDEILGGEGGGGSAPGEPSGPSGWGPNEGPEVDSDTVASGATKTYPVGAGETWGRRLVDQSASGANAHVDTAGGGWTVQDVGFSGVFNGRNLPEGDTLIHAKTPNGSGARIQHIWAGNGSSKARDTGVFFNKVSTGDLIVSEVNMQNWRDNALYLSAPHESGSGGPNIAIESSYAYNNETSSYRLGQGTIRNCVGEHDGSHSGRGNRVIWARPPGTVEVEDCDIGNTNGYAIWAGVDGGSSTVNLRNCRISGQQQEQNSSSINGSSGGSPNLTAYDGGIPGGPRQAAEGVGHGESGRSGGPGGGVQ